MTASCEICGKPGVPTTLGGYLCTDCVVRYDEYRCSRCSQRSLVLKDWEHSDLCGLCSIMDRINGLSQEQKEAMRDLATSGDRVNAIRNAKHLLGVSVGDAAFVARMLVG